MADAESNLVPSEAADQVEVALEKQAAADDGILYLNRVVDPDFSLPDHVIILDSDPAFNRERLELKGRELDSNDLKSLEHHEAIRQSYLKFAQTGLVPATVIRDIHEMDMEAVAQILDRIIGIHGHL